MYPGTCHRCGEYGHAYRECRLPAAKTRKELDARIDAIVERWNLGWGFHRSVKAELIQTETREYEKARKAA